MPRRDRTAMRSAPTQARSRDTVARILDAAAAEIREHGRDAATTNAIAARAGVSVGSYYQYFPNADAVVVALTEAHIEAAGRRCTAALTTLEDPSISVPEQVRTLVEAAVDAHGEDDRLHRELFHGPRGRHVDERLAALNRGIEAAVERWLLAVGVAASRASLTARTLTVTATALVHECVLADDLPQPVADRVAVVVQTCVGIVDEALTR